jgi:hypothetical protein
VSNLKLNPQNLKLRRVPNLKLNPQNLKLSGAPPAWTTDQEKTKKAAPERAEIRAAGYGTGT